ncbi:MAG: YceI family protein [Terriglobales bacterium]
MSTVGTPPATTVRYVIDAKASTFTVRAFATGMLSAFGHSPTIAIPDFEGEVKWDSGAVEDSSLRIVVQASSLTVTDDISKSDRSEIERRMHEEVLETDGFAEIIYECPRVSSVQKMGEGLFTAVLDGELTLHGVTLKQAISARVTLTGETLRAAGEFSIRQSDYEIRPVSAAGGTVKLKDELKLSFDIAARKA